MRILWRWLRLVRQHRGPRSMVRLPKGSYFDLSTIANFHRASDTNGIVRLHGTPSFGDSLSHYISGPDVQAMQEAMDRYRGKR